MQDNTIKALVSMLCITAMVMYALNQGINGTLLSAVVALVAGIGGYAVGTWKTVKNENKGNESSSTS